MYKRQAHGRTPGARSYVYLDESKEVYKRLIVSEDNKTLLGAVLVGDTSDYGRQADGSAGGVCAYSVISIRFSSGPSTQLS